MFKFFFFKYFKISLLNLHKDKGSNVDIIIFILLYHHEATNIKSLSNIYYFIVIYK